jgi:hypothetical protein
MRQQVGLHRTDLYDRSERSAVDRRHQSKYPGRNRIVHRSSKKEEEEKKKKKKEEKKKKKKIVCLLFIINSIDLRNGTHCDQEIDECDSTPCQNGVCIDKLQDYECQCEDGWEGKDCQTNIDL